MVSQSVLQTTKTSPFPLTETVYTLENKPRNFYGKSFIKNVGDSMGDKCKWCNSTNTQDADLGGWNPETVCLDCGKITVD